MALYLCRVSILGSSLTPAALFSAIGEALYGPQYRSELGRVLKVDNRQIRRWANGEYVPPVGVWEELAFLCSVRSDELKNLSAKAWSAGQKSGER